MADLDGVRRLVWDTRSACCESPFFVGQKTKPDFAAEASFHFPRHLHRVPVAKAKAMLACDGRLDDETLNDAMALAADEVVKVSGV